MVIVNMGKYWGYFLVIAGLIWFLNTYATIVMMTSDRYAFLNVGIYHVLLSAIIGIVLFVMGLKKVKKQPEDIKTSFIIPNTSKN